MIYLQKTEKLHRSILSDNSFNMGQEALILIAEVKLAYLPPPDASRLLQNASFSPLSLSYLPIVFSLLISWLSSITAAMLLVSFHDIIP